MKAVVMKVRDGYAAVLTEDGQFIKIKDRDYQPGMELTLEEIREQSGKKARVSRMRRVRTLLVSAAALFLLAVGVKDFYTPYSTVSIDVNPSIVMSANRYDLVLDIEAVNDDAEELVSRLLSESMRYRSIETVAEAAVSEISEDGYEAENGTTYIMMSANSKNAGHSEKIAEQLETIGSGYPDVSAMAIAADDALLDRANDAGTTAGKLYLVDRLGEAEDPAEFNESDWLQRPIKDIVQEIDRLETPEEEEPQTGTDAAPDSDPADGNTQPEDTKENAGPDTDDEPAFSPGENAGGAPDDAANTAENDPAESGGMNEPMSDPGAENGAQAEPRTAEQQNDRQSPDGGGDPGGNGAAAPAGGMGPDGK